MGRLLLLAAALALAACAGRGQLTVYPDAAAVGAIQPILVASAREADGSSNAFSYERAGTPRFARFEVSVPPDRAPGAVTFPRRLPPDPRSDFLTVSAQGLGGAPGFVVALNAELAKLPPGEREVLVFTHGFNTNFSEGLYRQAQMRHDFGEPGVSVHFSWASAGRAVAYAYDRESAILARDALRQTLEAVARSRAERVVVAAHSMGAMVLMEALRSMALAGDDAFFARLQAIVLMAPDLDVDVFRGQADPFDLYDTPVYVFFSSRDRALRLSARLRGDAERLGSIQDLARIDDLPVTLIDTSAVDDGADALGHFAVANSPTMIALIKGMDSFGGQIFIDAERSGVSPADVPVRVFQGVGQAVFNPVYRQP